jgi:hypothetical protein
MHELLIVGAVVLAHKFPLMTVVRLHYVIDSLLYRFSQFLIFRIELIFFLDILLYFLSFLFVNLPDE